MSPSFAEIHSRVLDALPNPVFLHDQHFRVLHANAAYLEEAGASLPDVQGLKYWEVFPQRNGPLSGCRQALDEDREVVDEVQLESGRTFLSQTFPIADEEGRNGLSAHILTEITSQRRAEESQTRQQAFMDAVHDQLPGPMYVFDDIGRILHWNQHFHDVMGFSYHQLLTYNPVDLFTPEAQEAIKNGIHQTFDTGEGTAEGTLAAPDAGALTYRFHARRLDGFGRPLAVGFGMDIAREKAVEHSLERANQALRTLHRANAALVQAGEEKGLLQEFCRIIVSDGGYFGAWVAYLSTDDPPHLQIQATYSQAGIAKPDSRGHSAYLGQESDDPFLQVRDTGAPLRVSGVFLPLEGVQEHSGAGAREDKTAAILPLGDNPLRGFLVVCSWDPEAFLGEEIELLGELAGDLDYGIRTLRLQEEREQHIARLRQSATVFENAAEGIIITDADERIVAVNDAFTQITGYTETDVLGTTPRCLSSDLHDADFYRTMWTALEQEGVWRGEIWNRRKSGEAYPEWLTITSVQDNQGRICNYVAVFSDLAKARETEAKLTYLTYHDPLTGLPNRSLFREYVSHALPSLDRKSNHLAVVSLDLEGFGRLNDSLGPQVGDAVLQEVAFRVNQALREDDTVSRPGGDEFWILLEDLRTGEDASRVVGHLLDTVRAPLEVEGRTLRLEAAAGIALAPMDSASVEGLIANASTALHRAQAQESGAMQFFNREMEASASRRLKTEQALKRALEEEELEVWYQPQLDLATDRILAAEALVRWRHPERGLIPPGEFIPVAEESGLVVPLGEWVLEQAVAHCARWRKDGTPLEAVGINVAASQFQRGRFPQKVADALQRHNLPGSFLELEITEEGFLADFDRALENLQRLTELGARLAIDDFGTGYSSLAYLKRLPVDTLKIDKSFIDGLPEEDQDRSIVEAILAVARQMGLAPLPEGVEEPNQAEWLRKEGVRRAQGFLWAKPMPPEEFEVLLRSNSSPR